MNIYKIKEQYGITLGLSVHRSSVFSPMEPVLSSCHFLSLFCCCSCFIFGEQESCVFFCGLVSNQPSVSRARQHFLKFILITMFNNPALLGSWHCVLQHLDAGSNMLHTKKVQTHTFLPVYLFPKPSLQRHELKAHFC